MRNIKRLGVVCFAFVLLLTTVMSAMLSGCGKKTKADPVSEETGLSGEYLAEPTESPGGPVDLSLVEDASSSDPDSVGQMTYYPNGNGALAALAGSNVFTLYFENPSVSIGSGFITFYEASTSTVYESVDIGNYDKCRVYPLDDSGSLLTGWDKGTMVEISLASPFMPGGSYYVLIDEGCFTDGVHASKQQLNASLIKFSVKDYGVDRLNGFAKTYAQGARAVMTVLLGGDAVRAQVAGYDGEYLAFSSSAFDVSSELTVTFLKEGSPSFRLEYYNAQGAMVDSMTFSVDVIGSSATVNIG